MWKAFWTKPNKPLSEMDGAVKKAIKAIPWIVSAAPADRTITVLLPDENNEAKGPQVMLELDATVHQNAQRYFESGQESKRTRRRGPLRPWQKPSESSSVHRKNEAKQKASGKLNRLKRSKRMWFEQHRWAMIEARTSAGWWKRRQRQRLRGEKAPLKRGHVLAR